MTVATTYLAVAFPIGEAEALHWWLIADDRIVASGQDEDVLAASEFIPSDPDCRTVALVPVSLTTVARHRMEDMKPAQAAAVARLNHAKRMIGADADLHVAAAVEETSSDEQEGNSVTVWAAGISASTMAEGLAQLQALGIDPDVVMPAGMVFPEPGDGWISAEIGAEKVLRGQGQLYPDEPPFRDLALSSGEEITVLTEIEQESALVAAVKAPPLNLRTGRFAKRRAPIRIAPHQLRTLAYLTAAILVTSLAIALTLLLKFEYGAERHDEMALAEIRKIIPDAQDVSLGETALDARLARRGLGAGSFGTASAALFAAVRDTGSVTVQQFSYGEDGTLTAVLAGPASEIEDMLRRLQLSGYVVTAQASQSGADGPVPISMRAP